MTASAPRERRPWFVRWLLCSGVIFAVWLGITIRCQYQAARQIKAAFGLDAPKPPPSSPVSEREPAPEPEPNVEGLWLDEGRLSVDQLSFSQDGRRLIGGDYDRVSVIWEITAVDSSQTVLRPAVTFYGQIDYVPWEALSPDLHWVATSNREGFLELWDSTVQPPRMVARSEDAQVGATVAISPDSRWLVTARTDGIARLWDLTADEPLANPHRLRGHNIGYAIPAAFTTDSRWLVTASPGGVRVWDLAGRLSLPAWTLTRPKYAGGSLAIGPNDRWLASGVVVWDLTADDPSQTARILGHRPDRNAEVTFGPGGRWLVMQNTNATARLWDLTAADPAGTTCLLSAPGVEIHRVTFSADGRRLAALASDATARVWDLTAAVPAGTLRVFRAPEAEIRCVALSADGRWLLTGSNDAKVHLWDLSAEGPAAARVLVGHQEYVGAVAFTPDSRWLVTAGYPRVRLWDFAAARRLPVSGTGASER